MTTITVDRAVLEQVLEALEFHSCGDEIDEQIITALRAALAQQEQDAEAWVDEASIAWLAEHPCGIITTRLVKQKSPERQMAMYAEPPRREWQSLSEEEIQSIHDTYHKRMGPQEFARAIEAKLKERNNG